MTDPRVEKLARILVDYSTDVRPGDRVAIESTTAAEPLVRAMYARVLERGGHAHLLLRLPDEEAIFYQYAQEAQLDFTPTIQKLVTGEFDVYIRARADTNTHALDSVPPEKQARFQKAYAPVRNQMLQRAAENTLRWVLSQYPTEAYAADAGMTLEEYADFLYSACHADPATADPVAFWQGVNRDQQRYIDRIEGHDRVQLRGPNVDLSLSIKGRKFLNSSGLHNVPDGEIYTGPVEDSLDGWVHYTYPAIHQGRMVEGIRLEFEQGKVVKATADKNQEFLLRMLDMDAGAHYVGEFAIGTNYQIDCFTKNILFDEKIGGTFHMALGAGYPETGSRNRSAIHWDMICDLRQDSEILVDGEVVYKNGRFTF